MYTVNKKSDTCCAEIPKQYTIKTPHCSTEPPTVAMSATQKSKNAYNSCIFAPLFHRLMSIVHGDPLVSRYPQPDSLFRLLWVIYFI